MQQGTRKKQEPQHVLRTLSMSEEWIMLPWLWVDHGGDENS
jgi:hypothetical protein